MKFEQRRVIADLVGLNKIGFTVSADKGIDQIAQRLKTRAVPSRRALAPEDSVHRARRVREKADKVHERRGWGT
ncbi:hypothetical protein ACSNOJ_11320 [Streptomyces sp. URMC 128]|uniref:hypothetical protein n=1 Tax=Streptomyces sp. URMC 128 TaxID=3423404 RepID=UPI003F1E00C6